jgi:hypothetical protein
VVVVDVKAMEFARALENVGPAVETAAPAYEAGPDADGNVAAAAPESRADALAAVGPVVNVESEAARPDVAPAAGAAVAAVAGARGLAEGVVALVVWAVVTAWETRPLQFCLCQGYQH